MSADSSVRIGTSISNNGTFAFFPTIFLYLLSFGLTKTATHAGRSSGRVVAINKSSLVLAILNLSVENKLGCSLSSSSAWAIAVWHSGHHIVGNSLL